VANPERQPIFFGSSAFQLNGSTLVRRKRGGHSRLVDMKAVYRNFIKLYRTPDNSLGDFAGCSGFSELKIVITRRRRSIHCSRINCFIEEVCHTLKFFGIGSSFLMLVSCSDIKLGLKFLGWIKQIMRGEVFADNVCRETMIGHYFEEGKSQHGIECSS
jgi:hypothetical protein